MSLVRITTWTSGQVLTAAALNAEFDNIVNNTVQTVAIASLTANSFTYLDASKLIATTGAPTNGQVLVGRTGTSPVAASITGTANKITVTLGSGTIALTIPDAVTLVTPTFTNAPTVTAFGTGLVHSNGSGVQTSSLIVNADITNTTIDLAAKVTGILPTANGGTGIAYFTAAGPTVARVYTFPDAAMSVGYLNIPQNSQNAGYTLVLTDAGKHIYMATAGTFTIPANSSVAFPIGTAVTFFNSTTACTIPITTDTMVLAGTATTGTRTLAANGVATALKVTATSWAISGTGLT